MNRTLEFLNYVGLSQTREKTKKSDFIIEATAIADQIHKLQTHFTDSKKLYFSFLGINGLSETEKDDMDRQWASLIKSCYSRIQNLSSFSNANEQLKQHFMAVEWILESKLSKISLELSNMQKRRKELRSVSTPIQQPLSFQEDQQAHDDFSNDLTSDQIQILERENESLLKKLQGDMDEVVKTTQTLQEIASLQSTLAHHLSAQQEVIESINSDILDSVDYMSNAQKQLKKTQQVFGHARIWVFVFLIVASFILLFLDYYG